jgi:hypothetical protein
LNLHGNGSDERERREKERGGDGGSHKEIKGRGGFRN